MTSEKELKHSKGESGKIPDKLLSIPGIEQAIELVEEHAWRRTLDYVAVEAEKGELGPELRRLWNDGSDKALDKFFREIDSFWADTEDGYLEDLAINAGPKIAELWGLSQACGEQLASLIYWKRSSSVPFKLVVNPKSGEVLPALPMELLHKNTLLLRPEGVQENHIYLDVTSLSYHVLRSAYGVILACRRGLGVPSRELKEGSPERIDTARAIQCAWRVDMGESPKQVARELGFRIYTSDNPSGSYPLFRKYLQRGREIQQKLEAFDIFLTQLDLGAGE